MATHVMVFVERRNGEIKRASLEALGAARNLVDGGSVQAVTLGPGASSDAPALAAAGADRVLAADDEWLELYSPEAYAACLAQAVREGGVRFLLLGGTAMGRDLAARTTARLDTVCASDLVAVEAGEDGDLRGTRPVYSGKALARVRLRAAPGVATLRPNAFPVPVPDETRAAEVTVLTPPVSADALRAKTVRVALPEQQEPDVAEASIVVSGGRGLKEAANFKLVRELAEALGGAVGASRAVVDAGWIPHKHQVGQTGKVVSPGLYVACGISGAIQHLAGMSTSKRIVAINKDPEAPIFKIADYGIVGDLFEVLPPLTEEIRKRRA